MLRYYRATGALLATVGSLVALIASSAPALAADRAVSADLRLALEGTPDRVGVGENATYTAFVRNGGPDQASNVTLSNDLGDKLAFVSASASQGSCSGSGPVSCALGTLAKGAYAKVTIIAKATKPGLAIDQAKVSASENDPTPGDNQRSVSTRVRATVADLRLALEGTPDRVGVGENATYTAFVRNGGPDQASNVTLSNDLGDKLAFVSASASQGSCSGSGPVSCALGTLAKGAYAKVTIIAKATKPGLAIDQAKVSASENDPTPGDNQRSVSTRVRATVADLRLALEGTPDRVGVGENATYTAFVRNGGPDQASNVTLSNDLGDKLAFVSASASQGSCSGSGPVSCALGTLAKGAYAKVTIIAKATKPGLAIDQAKVSASENDPTPGDNQRSVSTRVRATVADLRLALEGTPDRVGVGENATYTAFVRNGGPDQASNVTLSNDLGDKLAFVSASASQGSCSGSGPVSCALGTLAKGAYAKVTIIAKATKPGLAIDQAKVSASENDPTPGDNQRSVSTRVRATVADLRLALEGTPDRVGVGENATYTAFVRNGGPDQASNVTLSNDLGDKLAFVSASASQGSCSGSGPVSCALGTLAKGAYAKVTIIAKATKPGLAIDQAKVSASENDPTPGDNQRSVSTRVRATVADLRLALEGTPDRVGVGENATYTAFVRNGGPDQASNVTLSNDLGDKLAFVSASASQGSCSGSGPVSCALGTLAKGAYAKVTIIAKATKPGLAIDQAKVSASENDPTPGDNQRSESTTIRGPESV